MDERDLQGQEHLINWLGNDLRAQLPVGAELSPVRPDRRDGPGHAQRAERQARRSRIVVLCSPVVNPVADEIARLILDDLPAANLPARFR